MDVDWLYERSMHPVGYKRVNKVTGKEVSKAHIVKGVAYEKGRYVVLIEEEIRAAHPQSTQAIDIFAFVDSQQIPLQHIDKPYYLAPDRRGEKVYALLREALSGTDKVALAHVVLHSRQHLAALMPLQSALVLVLLRWPAEVRSLESLELGPAVSQAKLTKSELDMAKRLIKDMSDEWRPEQYQDSFQERILELVERKAKAGKVEQVERGEGQEQRRSADVVDLTELLKRSLGGTPKKTASKGTSSRKPARTARK